MTNGPTQEVLQMEGVTQDMALRFHLKSRMFPPIHDDFFPAIKQAIEYVDAGIGGYTVDLPNGRTLSAWDVIEQLHLEPFIYETSDDPEEFED